jgi:pimeloyl-ACP methyl ester carboxylesterase
MNHREWTDRQAETTVRADGHDLNVAYYDGGPGPDGSPADTLVFLHGIPTWSFLWRDVAPAFADDLDGEVVELEGAYHWVVEDRTGRYREELRTSLSETHTTEGGE